MRYFRGFPLPKRGFHSLIFFSEVLMHLISEELKPSCSISFKPTMEQPCGALHDQSTVPDARFLPTTFGRHLLRFVRQWRARFANQNQFRSGLHRSPDVTEGISSSASPNDGGSIHQFVVDDGKSYQIFKQMDHLLRLDFMPFGKCDTSSRGAELSSNIRRNKDKD